MALPILILHGWGSCAKNWSKIREFLENQGYKVLVPDLPGFGKNPPPTKPWSLDDYVEWVKEFCEKKNLSRIFLLGHSFGGGLAVKYSLRFPEKIEKLFLVGAALFRKRSLRYRFLTVVSKIFKIFSFLPFYILFKKGFYKFIVRKSDYPYLKGTMKDSYLKVIKEDLSEILSLVKVRTIIIWGQKDDVTPIKDAYFINKKIKKSKLIIIPEGNHDLEQKTPHLLAEKILQNLR